MTPTGKVREAFVITQIDEGGSERAEAETALKAHGCTVFVHTNQADIRNDQMWLQSVGYVLDCQ